ncbi:MAG: esterase-like activity of phytase family protein, partial [Solirubrobacterales bacterium]|nr:esterase-like activity of phytase family protein [Solirubrobacterales bacterium]
MAGKTWRRRFVVVAALAGGGLAPPLAAPAAARWSHHERAHRSFNHVGTFNVPANLRAGEPQDTATSAEIVDATPDGRTLVYTDAATGRLGFIDALRPQQPTAGGTIDLGGQPTSVATLGRYALAAVTTSSDPDGDGPLNGFDAPSGELVVVDTRTRAILRRIALAGQPDSVAISPDRRYAAIVIENERDEEDNDGLIPQPPAGTLQVLEVKRLFKRDPKLQSVDLTGLAATAPDDPEPEFVDINERNEAVVSLQENNHLAIVDLKRARVRRHFSAGSVRLAGIDATEDDLGPQGSGVISLGESIERRREPDAVQWVDEDTFATANEGDYEDAGGQEGGSRSFTLFHSRGFVEYESGASFEHAIVRAGHYPEGRSENKGNEPEGLEVARMDGREYLFVGSERANVVGVYDVSGRTPKLEQLLPTGIGPEGIKAIPDRDLLAVSAETDGVADGFAIRSIVTLYELGRGEPRYPMLESADEGGLPIPWVALSGLAGDPVDRDGLWMVSDSVLAQAYIYEIDVSGHPARIVERIAVGGVDVADQRLGDYDLEGIVARREGGFWLASEGRTNAGSSRPNLLLRVAADGAVMRGVALPPSLVSQATGSGFEGVTVTGSAAAGDETLWAVIQRQWKDDAVGFVKLARYDVAAG